MTECLGLGGRPCQEVGVARWKGRRVEAWLVCTDTSLHFSRLEKAVLGCAHLQRVTVFTTFPGSTDFSVIQLNAACIFRARAEQTVEALLPRYVQKHSTSDSKARLAWVAGAGGGSMCRDKDPCLDKQCLPLGG